MTHRSISQLKTFRRCGEAYRLQRVTDVKRSVPAAWTIKGHAFHSAYETWEQYDRHSSLAGLFEDHWDEQYAISVGEEPDLERWTKTPRVTTTERDLELRRRDGIQEAEVYQEHCEIAEWKLLWVADTPMVEVAGEITLGNITVKYGIDCVLVWPDGTVTLRDIKTGNREVDSTQLGVYRLALKKNYDIDVNWGEFWYTKDGGNREVNLARYTEDYLTDQFVKLDKAITSGIYLANPGKNCEMCDVKEWCREMGWNYN